MKGAPETDAPFICFYLLAVRTLVVQILRHAEMHPDVLVGIGSKGLERSQVAILGIAVEQRIGRLVCRDLLADIAMIEIGALGGAQIVQQPLMQIVDMLGQASPRCPWRP